VNSTFSKSHRNQKEYVWTKGGGLIFGPLCSASAVLLAMPASFTGEMMKGNNNNCDGTEQPRP